MQHRIGFAGVQSALRNHLAEIFFSVFSDDEYEIGAGQPSAAAVKDSNQMRMRQLGCPPPGRKLRVWIARRGANQLDRGLGGTTGDAS
jgi:hypothetical protein